MSSEEQKKSVKANVLESIKEGDITMKPRWQFVFAGVLAVTGGVILVLWLVYLLSFILFMLRQTGVWFVPGFGVRGWPVFLLSLPWALIAVAMVFIIVLEILVRQYAFAYRRPLLYSVLGIVIVVFAGGFFVARTRLHHSLFMSAEHHQLPFGSLLYRNFGEQQFHDIHRGKIVATTTAGFTLNTPYGPLFNVLITTETRLPDEAVLGPGDMVVIFGSEASDTIEAIGVRKIGYIE